MASGAVDPINNPEAWDFVLIGGVQCPGRCKVGEFKRANEWDIKKGKGSLGATVTYVSRPPAKGGIEFYLWLPIHFQQWETFRPLFKYDPTKKAVKAIDIYHPGLADIDVTSVVCEMIGNLQNDGMGLWTVKVDLLEYFPPPAKPAISTPQGAVGNAPTPGSQQTGAQPPDADTALQQQIGALLAQASAP